MTDMTFDPAVRFGNSPVNRDLPDPITVKNTELKQKFIELRARGLSFDKIAGELHVSKPTLITWSRELAETIKNYSAIEREALQEQYLISRKARVELLGGLLKTIKDELASRDLKDVPTHKLFELLLKYAVNLKDDEMPLEFSEASETRNLLGNVNGRKEDKWSA